MARRKFNKLKSLMYESEITQDYLADQLGRSSTYINRRMTGKGAFDTTDIAGIANILQIPPAEWIDFFFEGV